MTLVDLLIQAIEAQREQIDSSRLARGEAGRVELQVNLSQRRIDVQVLVRDRRAA
jgi:hypothetical protein